MTTTTDMITTTDMVTTTAMIKTMGVVTIIRDTAAETLESLNPKTCCKQVKFSVPGEEAQNEGFAMSFLPHLDDREADTSNEALSPRRIGCLAGISQRTAWVRSEAAPR